MKIKFWKNTKEDNNVNVKDVNATPILDLTGTLREGTSVITPEIVIESDKKILTCNYCYIEEFSRYYFIKDIQPLTNRLWKLSLSVDVCYTYRDYIYSQTGFVERNESYFNPNIEDKERDMLFPESFTIVPCSQYQRNGAVVDKWTSGVTAKRQNTILTLACANASFYDDNLKTSNEINATGDKIIAPTYALRDIAGINLPDNKSVPILALPDKTHPEYYHPLDNLIGTFVNDTEYQIVNVCSFPFDIDKAVEVAHGYDKPNRVYKNYGSALSVPFKALPADYDYGVAKVRWYCLADFNITSLYEDDSLWLNYKRKIDIYIPYCGWISLDMNQIINSNIRVYCLPSFVTMTGFFFVTSENKILWSGQSQIGQPITYSKDNSRIIRDETIQFSISTAISALTLGAGVALAPATAGASMIPAVSAGIGTAGKAVSMMTTRHNNASPQISSANQGLINYQEPMLRIMNPQPVQVFLDDYKKVYGLPCHETLKLSTLTGKGFTIAKGVKLKGDSFITSTEKQMIISALENGVIL